MGKDIRRWKKIKGKVVYNNPWIKIHEDKVLRPDGKEGVYGYLEKPVGVFIIANDEKEGTVYFIKQHRYPIRKNIYEIPAGVANSKNYLKEAKRELAEETGITAKRWEHLGSFFVAPGHESTKIEVYLATRLDTTQLMIGKQEADEAISQIIKINVKDLPKKIKSGKIECGITLAALAIFLQQREG